MRVVRRHNGWLNAEVDRLGPLLASARSEGEEAVAEWAQRMRRALNAF